MSTPAELQAELQKILDEEFPYVAKYVWFEPFSIGVNSHGVVDYTYYCQGSKHDHRYGHFMLRRFREIMAPFAEKMKDLIANGEQVCDECRHYLDEYKYVATMISFRDFSAMKLPTSMKCVHEISRSEWRHVNHVHWYEDLCRQLRVLPLPIATEILEYY